MDDVAGTSALVGGVAILALLVVDALTTTLDVSRGGGPLTRHLTTGAWRLVLWARRGRGGSGALAVAGPAFLVGTVLVWVLLLWAAWTLVYLSSPGAVLDAGSGEPAGWVGTAYFAGFTVFTLGVGDLVPGDGWWQLLTVVATFSGLFLVTLSITYVLSVVSAVVSRRSLAVHVEALGGTAERIVLCGWDGERFESAYEQHLVALGSEVGQVAERHLAYPILHYFHAPSRHTSAAVAVAELDDALLLLGEAVAPDARPSASAIGPLRRTIDRYVETVAAVSGAARGPDPPPLDLALLRREGVPMLDPDTWAQLLDAAADRRDELSRLAHASGWERPSDRAAGRPAAP